MAALAVAIGGGDRDALDALEPSPEELAASIAGDTGAVRLAILTGHTELVDWMLDHAPALTQQRFPPHGGTLLHLAVEAGDPHLVGLALSCGVDPAQLDRAFGATARGWAQHFGRDDLADLLPVD